MRSKDEEIEVSGTEEFVTKVIGEWRGRVSTHGESVAESDAQPTSVPAGESDQASQAGVEKLRKIVREDGDALLLEARPTGEMAYAEGFALLLLAHLRFKNETSVLATRVKDSLSRSGMGDARLDRALRPVET
ncbi:MAG: hypothetical protein FD180_4536 [Planctomycetota bacterium]|nr:MAG: hypothetical protein FD180_4536 [Planctomycetota bacterium]